MYEWLKPTTRRARQCALSEVAAMTNHEPPPCCAQGCLLRCPTLKWHVESTHYIQSRNQHAPHRICSVTAAQPSCPTTAPRLSIKMLAPPLSDIRSTDRVYRHPHCVSAIKMSFTPDLCSTDASLLQAAMPQLPRVEYAHQVELAAGTCACRTALAHA